MFEDLTKQIQKELAGEYPNEGCGVISDGKFIKTKNIAEDPANNFHISQKEVEKLEHPIQAVVHSHPDAPEVPSSDDMQLALKMDLPVGVVRTEKKGFASNIVWYNDGTQRPLLGRTFIHGVADCYSLIRDYFKQELGVELADHPRDWNWWDKGQNLYDDLFGKTGFKEVEDAVRTGDVKKNDVLLMCINRIDVISHAGVYLGDDLFIHHAGSMKPLDPNRVSKKDILLRYMPYVKKVVRYAS